MCVCAFIIMFCKSENYCNMDDYGISQIKNVLIGTELNNKINISFKTNYTGTHTLFHNNSVSQHVSNGTYVTTSISCDTASGIYVLQTENNSIIDCQFFNVIPNCTATLTSIVTIQKGSACQKCKHMIFIPLFVVSLYFV
ncbi:protein E49 [Elephant endotheliotropic herpesvirus 6]|nr:protein E49 [Elephant endotheliotropic herpesvirus 6]